MRPHCALGGSPSPRGTVAPWLRRGRRHRSQVPPPAGSEVEERGGGREGEEGEGVAEDGGGQEGEEGARGVDCAPEGGHGRDARAARCLASHSSQREREVVLVRELVVIDVVRPPSLPKRRKRKKKRRKRTTRRP